MTVGSRSHRCSHQTVNVPTFDGLSHGRTSYYRLAALSCEIQYQWRFGSTRSLLVARGSSGVSLFTRRRSSVRDRSVPFAFSDLARHSRRAFHLGADRVQNFGLAQRKTKTPSHTRHPIRSPKGNGRNVGYRSCRTSFRKLNSRSHIYYLVHWTIPKDSSLLPFPLRYRDR